MSETATKELAEVRWRKLRDLVHEHGILRVEELAAELGVSAATVRRDLAALEASGELRRIHGGAMAPERCAAEPLFDEPFLLATRDDGPLADEALIELDDLADQTLLLLEDGHCLRDQALDVCRTAGAGENGGFRATSLETLRQMVAANVGVTLLPSLAVKPPVAQSDAIRLLPFRDPQPSRRIAMVWRRSSAMGDFLEQLAAEFKRLPQELLTTDSPRSRKPTTPAKRARG